MTTESDTRLAARAALCSFTTAQLRAQEADYQHIQPLQEALASGRKVVVPAEALKVIEAARQFDTALFDFQQTRAKHDIAEALAAYDKAVGK